MKIVRFSAEGKTGYGVLTDGDVVQCLSGDPCDSLETTEVYYEPDKIKLLAPTLPSKIVALGVNYRSHGEEMSHRLPTEPLLFIKPSTAVIGPEDGIVYPESSERVDYEGELGVVIKSLTHKVSEKDAPRYILGYTCFNDVTARDLQARDKQWTRSKGFDTFAPIGPWIETDLDPSDLALETRLNGEVRQHSRTSELVFPAFKLVSFISDIMTLLPGDVIATGTPAGIGPMQSGDTVEVEIEGIGMLRNHVVK
jgi:2-keto-4-pentenoate hydratase/2-oxohepta-3-ene-1,7-dioic acid hydratase in catechol pathway